jgi:hypothetical protein
VDEGRKGAEGCRCGQEGGEHSFELAGAPCATERALRERGTEIASERRWSHRRARAEANRRQKATRWMSAEGQACPDASYLKNGPREERERRGRGDQQRWLPGGGSELRLDSGSVRGWGWGGGGVFRQYRLAPCSQPGSGILEAFPVGLAGCVAKLGWPKNGRPALRWRREKRWRTRRGGASKRGERAHGAAAASELGGGGGLDRIY